LVSWICLQAEPIRLGQEPVRYQQEQRERLRAQEPGSEVLMQQRIPLVWGQQAAWEEQVSQA